MQHMKSRFFWVARGAQLDNRVTPHDLGLDFEGLTKPIFSASRAFFPLSLVRMDILLIHCQGH
jgi:hypothetical protein